MATYYIKELQTVQPQGPYFLGGHSFGGHVAFEMAQQLQRHGHEVALLVILDSTAPRPINNPIWADWDEARWLTEIATGIEQLLGKNLGVSIEVLKHLSSSEQLNYLHEQLKMANWLPPFASIKQLRGLLQVFKANSQTHYVPQEVYSTPISLFCADEILSDERLSEEIRPEPTWGWQPFTAEPVEVHVIPGNHFTMMTKPHVKVLAERLVSCLEKFSTTSFRTASLSG